MNARTMTLIQAERAAAPPAADGEQASSMKNYSAAVHRGLYARDQGGLRGKFDNVRRFWENEVSRLVLRDFVPGLAAGKNKKMRVLDLGSGSGEGYEILLGMTGADPGFERPDASGIDPETMEYKGLDLCPEMVLLGNQTYQDAPNVAFGEADLSKGLGSAAEDLPYDLYFSSYGPLSHLTDSEMEGLLGQIMAHAKGKFVFVADLLGRFSVEWPSYWRECGGKDKRQEYSMCYLYPPGSKEAAEAERFPIRFWGGREFDRLVDRVAAKRGCRVIRRRLCDRSVLVGRHTVTSRFDRNVRPIRYSVNRLFEPNLRTDLEELLFTPVPREGFDEVNLFHTQFQAAWNGTVLAAQDALLHWRDTAWLKRDEPAAGPECVAEGSRLLRRTVLLARDMGYEDARASLVEPQLALLLRQVETRLQRGLGAAHGLLAAYEIVRP